jgi:long-chain fatty acid transport protein
MGAGLYVPVGYHFDWADTIPYGGTIGASLSRELSVIAGNVSLATEIHPRLSLGGSVELLYGKIESDAEKVVANSGILDYTWGLESECEGLGLEAAFGSLFKPSDAVAIGAVYRTGSTLKLDGHTNTQLSTMGFAEHSDLLQ